MTEDLGTLLIHVGIDGTGATTSGLKDVKTSLKNVGDQSDESNDKTKKFNLTLLDLVRSASAATVAIGGVVAALSAFSGVRLAAQYQAVEIGLTNILHSATAAKRVMGELIQMGAQTPFPTEHLVGFARQLLATGSSARSAVNELRTLANVGANMGLGVSDVGDLVRMLSTVRTTMHAPGADTFQALSRHGVNLAEVLSASGGARFTGSMANAQAASVFGAMPGPMAFAKIMEGLQKLNPGGADTFLSVVQNLGESIRNVMLPTGALLIRVLAPIGKLLQSVANAVARVNEMTGGGAGLIFLLAGLARIQGVLVNTAIAAANAIARLNVQLAALAGTGGVAGGKGGGMIPIIGGGLKSLGPAIAAAGALFGAEQIRKHGYSKMADTYYYGDLMANTIQGAAGGEILGGPLGGIVGAISGLFKTMYDYTYGGEKYHNKDRDKLDQIAENTGKTADALQQMRGTLIGGGDRAQRVTGDIEAQINLARALALSKGFG